MRHDAAAIQTHQQCASVFCVIKHLPQIAIGRVREQSADLGDPVLVKLLLEDVENGDQRTFNGFEHDVAHKTIADNHIRDAAQHVLSLDIADEIELLGFRKQLVSFTAQTVALGAFFTDIEQRDPRLLRVKKYL